MTPYIELPARSPVAPVVVSIPHTGTALPPRVAGRFATAAMRKLPMTDWHLHELYDFLPDLGVSVIHARFSRLAIDLNRPPDAGRLYPGRFETGLVPEETFDGERIFREPPDAGTLEALRQRYHAPYHERLGQLLLEAIERCGRVVLIDAHSVASRANRVHGALKSDVYLGDRDGTSCEPWLTTTLGGAFGSAGLRVQLNDPYKGGYITQHYGQWPGVDALQIEMCQRLYMNEDEPHQRLEEKWEKMKTILVSVFTTLKLRLGRG